MVEEEEGEEEVAIEEMVAEEKTKWRSWRSVQGRGASPQCSLARLRRVVGRAARGPRRSSRPSCQGTFLLVLLSVVLCFSFFFSCFFILLPLLVLKWKLPHYPD